MKLFSFSLKFEFLIQFFLSQDKPVDSNDDDHLLLVSYNGKSPLPPGKLAYDKNGRISANTMTFKTTSYRSSSSYSSSSSASEGFNTRLDSGYPFSGYTPALKSRLNQFTPTKLADDSTVMNQNDTDVFGVEDVDILQNIPDNIPDLDLFKQEAVFSSNRNGNVSNNQANYGSMASYVSQIILDLYGPGSDLIDKLSRGNGLNSREFKGEFEVLEQEEYEFVRLLTEIKHLLKSSSKRLYNYS